MNAQFIRTFHDWAKKKRRAFFFVHIQFYFRRRRLLIPLLEYDVVWSWKHVRSLSAAEPVLSSTSCKGRFMKEGGRKKREPETTNPRKSNHGPRAQMCLSLLQRRVSISESKSMLFIAAAEDGIEKETNFRSRLFLRSEWVIGSWLSTVVLHSKCSLSWKWPGKWNGRDESWRIPHEDDCCCFCFCCCRRPCGCLLWVHE